jgi:ABC-type lipoprotein export system ATPase subunit
MDVMNLPPGNADVSKLSGGERRRVALCKLLIQQPDLLLLDGDPTRNIEDLRKVALVMTRGKLIYPNEINQSLGVKPFVTNPPKLRRLN